MPAGVDDGTEGGQKRLKQCDIEAVGHTEEDEERNDLSEQMRIAQRRQSGGKQFFCLAATQWDRSDKELKDGDSAGELCLHISIRKDFSRAHDGFLMAARAGNHLDAS